MCFRELAKIVRPAAASRIVFETARPAHRDWLVIEEVETEHARAPWHPSSWSSIATRNDGTNPLLAAYPGKFGVVRARQDGNTFTLETSQVGDLRILLLPEVVDFAKPVVVVRDGVEVHREIVPLSKVTMLDALWSTFDRQRLPGASLLVPGR